MKEAEVIKENLKKAEAVKIAEQVQIEAKKHLEEFKQPEMIPFVLAEEVKLHLTI